jgi:hypothetical protein
MILTVVHQLTSYQQLKAMAHERVMMPWILAGPDIDGDIKVTAAPNVTVSIFWTFIELKN